MATLKSPTLTIVALVLLALAAGVFVSAGRWQLSRAQERRAIAAEIDAGRKQAPLAVTGATPAQELVPWRPARVEGTWRNDLSLLLDEDALQVELSSEGKALSRRRVYNPSALGLCTPASSLPTDPSPEAHG